MLRLVITPDTRNVSIEFPANFVGKQLEVIAFTIEETMSGATSGDRTVTNYASEKSLDEDWLSSHEDSAWQDL